MFVEVEVELLVVSSEVEEVVAADDELVILDEADQLLLDKLLYLKAKFCIGLTATPFAKLEGVEGDYLNEDLKFKVYDSGIVSKVRSAEPKPVDSFE